MKKLKIGIIGVGQISQREHLEYYTKMEHVEMTALCDIDEAKLNRMSDRYGVVHRYADFRKLLERDDLDAVDVCLHNNFHAPVAIAALRSGKHVYCEKPIAGSFADGKAMVDAAKETNRHLHIQLGKIFELETWAAKAIIDEGRLGELYHARSSGFRRRGRPYVDGYGAMPFVQQEIAGGGALFDMGVYNISQMLFLLGNPVVERISGKVYQKMAMDARRARESGYNVEELGLGFVKFEGGATMDIFESWAVHLPGLDGNSIVGTTGGIRLSPFSYHTTIADMDMNSTVDLQAAAFRWGALKPHWASFQSPLHHWVAALQGETALLPTAELALNTMLISEGIYLSSRTGCEVGAEEVAERSISTAVRL